MRLLFVGCEGPDASRIVRLFGETKDSDFSYMGLHAVDAIEALDKFHVQHPDLVFIHLDLGKNDSKRICETIRENEGARHTGILFLANESDGEGISVECLEMGADDVIRKGCGDREILARTNAVLRLKAMTDELRSANHKLRKLSYTDDLTGLDNMRAFNGKYASAVKSCQDGHSGLGVIMLDLDNFKHVNDNTNHLMGSHVISEMGKLIVATGVLEEFDCAARFGGDEYVIFTMDENLAAVAAKAQSILEAVRAAIFVKDGSSVKITTSIGVAWTAPNYPGKEEDPIKAADMMLYKSKAEGRDRVSIMQLNDPAQLDALLKQVEIEEGEKETYARIYHM